MVGTSPSTMDHLPPFSKRQIFQWSEEVPCPVGTHNFIEDFQSWTAWKQTTTREKVSNVSTCNNIFQSRLCSLALEEANGLLGGPHLSPKRARKQATCLYCQPTKNTEAERKRKFRNEGGISKLKTCWRGLEAPILLCGEEEYEKLESFKLLMPYVCVCVFSLFLFGFCLLVSYFLLARELWFFVFFVFFVASVYLLVTSCCFVFWFFFFFVCALQSCGFWFFSLWSQGLVVFVGSKWHAHQTQLMIIQFAFSNLCFVFTSVVVA